MNAGPDHQKVHEDEPPSTGYFVLFLSVLLVLSGLWVTGVIPGLFE